MEKIIAWRYRRHIPREKLDMYEHMLAEWGAAIDIQDEDGMAKELQIDVIFDAAHPRQQLVAALGLVEQLAGLEATPIALQPVADEDWQAKARASFPAIHEGTFFIYGFEEEVPEGKIGLHIPAGMAFGSGEHATTALCLGLYEQLAAQQDFTNGLDMGAGSGILAIAAALHEHIPFLAVDIDALAVKVCAENVVNNHVENLVTSVHGNGFLAAGVLSRAPFDLIFANILRNPLIEMAPQLEAALAPGGVAILSGFTGEQVADVTAAYEDMGLNVGKQAARGDWRALAVHKPAA